MPADVEIQKKETSNLALVSVKVITFLEEVKQEGRGYPGLLWGNGSRMQNTTPAKAWRWGCLGLFRDPHGGLVVRRQER